MFPLAENSGLQPIVTVAGLKANQKAHNNPYLGVDCMDLGTNDMKEQRVFDTLLGKKQQVLLATQVVRMILKVCARNADVVTLSHTYTLFVFIRLTMLLVTVETLGRCDNKGAYHTNFVMRYNL
jgi:hypothetical protein